MGIDCRRGSHKENEDNGSGSMAEVAARAVGVESGGDVNEQGEVGGGGEGEGRGATNVRHADIDRTLTERVHKIFGDVDFKTILDFPNIDAAYREKGLLLVGVRTDKKRAERFDVLSIVHFMLSNSEFAVSVAVDNKIRWGCLDSEVDILIRTTNEWKTYFTEKFPGACKRTPSAVSFQPDDVPLGHLKPSGRHKLDFLYLIAHMIFSMCKGGVTACISVTDIVPQLRKRYGCSFGDLSDEDIFFVQLRPGSYLKGAAHPREAMEALFFEWVRSTEFKSCANFYFGKLVFLSAAFSNAGAASSRWTGNQRAEFQKK